MNPQAPSVAPVMRVLHWLIVLVLPFALAAAVITWVVGPWYPTWAYGRPNFPADPFGFSAEQRLELALVAVDYLERRDSAANTIFLLEEQRLPGTNEPLYNQREIDHMLDVKNLTDLIRTGGTVLGVLVVGGLTVMLARRPTELLAYQTLWRGGLATVLLLLAIGAFLLLAWDVFFVQFHELLFPPDSWTFNFSDSLIRLFPEKFWFDIGVIIVGATFAAGLLLAALGRFFAHRTERRLRAVSYARPVKRPTTHKKRR